MTTYQILEEIFDMYRKYHALKRVRIDAVGVTHFKKVTLYISPKSSISKTFIKLGDLLKDDLHDGLWALRNQYVRNLGLHTGSSRSSLQDLCETNEPPE